MSGKMIDIPTADGKKLSGYLAAPESGKGPGLIVIQEIFGVNSHIREVCDLYAKEGFWALAPDVFWRLKPGVQLGYNDKDIQEGFGYYQKLDWNLAAQDLIDSINTLKTTVGCTKVGCVGYCFGGNMAYRLAAKNQVEAAVSYYGGGIDQILDQAKNIKTPILLHFGELDGHIPLSQVEHIQQALSTNKQAQVCIYQGADHGFNCDQRPSYNRTSAMLAYAKSAAFLHQYLSG